MLLGCLRNALANVCIGLCLVRVYQMPMSRCRINKKKGGPTVNLTFNGAPQATATAVSSNAASTDINKDEVVESADIITADDLLIAKASESKSAEPEKESKENEAAAEAPKDSKGPTATGEAVTLFVGNQDDESDDENQVTELHRHGPNPPVASHLTSI